MKTEFVGQKIYSRGGWMEAQLHCVEVEFIILTMTGCPSRRCTITATESQGTHSLSPGLSIASFSRF